MKPIIKVYLTMLALTLAFAASAGSAWANVAAGVQITNTATLTFDGGTVSSGPVIVTVSLLPAQPNVAITKAIAAYTAPHTPTLPNLVTITSQANGSAVYTVVNPLVANSDNTTAPSVNFTGGTTVTIGATVTTGTSGTTFVTVPTSGINGIAPLSTIVFVVNGNTYTVQVESIANNGATSQINWAATAAIPLADVPGTGTQVGEQKTVSLTVDPGTVITAGNIIQVGVSADVSTPGVALVTAANTLPNPYNTWTTTVPAATLVKYVRNVTTSASNTGTPHAYGSINYYESLNVTARPGETLEYILIANNTSATATTASVITDALPSAFVALKPAVYSSGTRDITYDNNGTVLYLTMAADADQATYTNPNLTVNIGAGSTSGSGGQIDAGAIVHVLYQVTVN
jgi:hypothetical protein